MKPLPPPDWPHILKLRAQATRKAHVFRALTDARGAWVPGQLLVDVGGGYDARTRCSRLEDRGVPVESRASSESTLFERRIPEWWLSMYEEKQTERRAS